MAANAWRPVQEDTGPWKAVDEIPAPTSGPVGPIPEPAGLQGNATPGENNKVALSNGLIGAGKSLISHIQTGERALVPHGVTGDKTIMSLPSTPHGQDQELGAGLENAGEWAMPIGGPESAIGRIGLQALRGGLVNKGQGGSFTAGAAMGGGGEGVAQGIKAVAPGIAESALNIRKTDRAYKPAGSIGKSILDETQGVRPGTVAESAQGRLNILTPELNAAAHNSTAPTSLQPARDVLNQAGLKAVTQNEPTTFGQLKPMAGHLTANQITGRAVSQTPTPSELLNLKRGFGNEFVHNWNPETMSGVKGTAAQTYHAMGEEFNRAVPEARELNSRISNLIPVAKRGESAELNAPTSQRIAGRVLAHTGALTGAGIGGAAGYHKGGLLGGLVGGAAGLAAPEMIGSPEGQMIAARTLHSGVSAPLIRGTMGALANANRKNAKEGEQ